MFYFTGNCDAQFIQWVALWLHEYVLKQTDFSLCLWHHFLLLWQTCFIKCLVNVSDVETTRAVHDPLEWIQIQTWVQNCWSAVTLHNQAPPGLNLVACCTYVIMLEQDAHVTLHYRKANILGLSVSASLTSFNSLVWISGHTRGWGDHKWSFKWSSLGLCHTLEINTTSFQK